MGEGLWDGGTRNLDETIQNVIFKKFRFTAAAIYFQFYKLGNNVKNFRIRDQKRALKF